MTGKTAAVILRIVINTRGKFSFVLALLANKFGAPDFQVNQYYPLMNITDMFLALLYEIFTTRFVNQLNLR